MGAKRLTQEEFIKRAKKIHGDKYDYSKAIFNNVDEKVCLICKEHGEFWQSPYKHINRKQGCPYCSRNVKFTKEYFAMFARQISEKQEDGKKKVMEKGWFQRGVKVMCTGFRREDTFVCKSYKHTPTHQLYKITSISKDGTLMEIEHERYQVGENII